MLIFDYNQSDPNFGRINDNNTMLRLLVLLDVIKLIVARYTHIKMCLVLFVDEPSRTFV